METQDTRIVLGPFDSQHPGRVGRRSLSLTGLVPVGTHTNTSSPTSETDLTAGL